MNVLFLAHRIPFPPDKGDKIRSFHEIVHLAKRHTVDLACMLDEKNDREHVGALLAHCRSVSAVYRGKRVARILALMGILTGKPLSVLAFRSRALERKIAEAIRARRPDAIVVFSSAMAEYVKDVEGIPRIMDFVDVDSEKWRAYGERQKFPLSWVYRLEADRLASYEEDIARSFDRSIVVSEKEAEILKRRVPGIREIDVIPNGVDLERFAPAGPEGAGGKEISLVFTGAMDYFANVDGVRYFCEDVFPAIREAVPGCRFYIVGHNPTRPVRELARDPAVTVTGYVPDVLPYLRRASVAVAPLRIARGVQNKVLEAMAAGLPVVGTPQSFQGLGASADDGIRAAANPAAFAREVIALLQDSAARKRCSAAARSFVERTHRWDDQMARLDALLEDAVREAARRRGTGA